MKDLVVLVPDKNTEAAMKALLEHRPHALGIRPITFDIFVHPRRDPGVYHEAEEFFRPLQSQYRYALVLFDFAFDGAPPAVRTAQDEVQEKLNRSGWKGKSAVVVINPELEAWVFGGSTYVVQELANGDRELFQQVIAEYGALPPDVPKPLKPKEAMEELLRRSRRPRSSAMYGDLAQRVSLESCRDAGFARLRKMLQGWFQFEKGQ